MKNKIKVNYTALAVLAVGVATIGSLAYAQSYNQKANVVIENQTVNGNNLFEGSNASDEVLGAQRQSGSASAFTNLKLTGAKIMCNSDTSTRCRAEMVEVQRFPFTTTTLVLENPISGTSTVSVQIVPLSPTAASSSFNLNAFASSSPYVAFNQSFVGGYPRSVPRLIDQYRIATGTTAMIDSMAYVSTTLQANSNYMVGGKVMVGPTQDLIVFLQHEHLVCENAGVVCENPTSTNRGLDFEVVATWQWMVSSTVEF